MASVCYKSFQDYEKSHNTLMNDTTTIKNLNLGNNIDNFCSSLESHNIKTFSFMKGLGDEVKELEDEVKELKDEKNYNKSILMMTEFNGFFRLENYYKNTNPELYDILTEEREERVSLAHLILSPKEGREWKKCRDKKKYNECDEILKRNKQNLLKKYDIFVGILNKSKQMIIKNTEIEERDFQLLISDVLKFINNL
jgi:hypothetical protein